MFGGNRVLVIEPKGSIDYIEKNFDMKLETPAEDAIGTIRGISNSPGFSSIQDTDVCLSCSKPFSAHHRKYYTSGGKTSYRCNTSPYSNSFSCKKIIVLKECSESGKFEKTFTIAEESDQTKLKKFLDFVSS